MTEKPKSINSLMKYLRNHHNIEIKGVVQKRKLRNIGYYHGFKGYRYNKHPMYRITYTDFNQILAINEFDMALKTMFYPQIMFTESALKNYALEIILEESKTANFNDIFNEWLSDYKTYTVPSGYKKVLQKLLSLRAKVYSTLTYAYSNDKKVITHFYYKNENVPIWAIFEVISLGEFGTFVQCLSPTTKGKISKSLSLNQSCDFNAKLTQSIIYIVKDLRNAVAHNEIIFDTRFRNTDIGYNVKKCIEIDVGIKDVIFENIVDYLILITYLLKNFKVPKLELLKTISSFENAAETLRKKIPISMYMSILPTDTKNKLTQLKAYARK